MKTIYVRYKVGPNFLLDEYLNAYIDVDDDGHWLIIRDYDSQYKILAVYPREVVIRAYEGKE